MIVPASATEPGVLEHRHSACLAQLISLLSHSEVVGNPQRSDAALDMISCLREDAPPAEIVRAFCRLRETCETVCYLILFRLRRRLEDAMVVTVGNGAPQALDLSFRSMGRIIQNYRRRQWEWTETNHSWKSYRIEFHWKHSSPRCELQSEVELAA